MLKRFLMTTMVMMLMLLWALPVDAAGLMAEGAASVNPPGWVGGLLALLSLILPAVVVVWMRRQR